MKLEYYTKNVYGNELAYLADPAARILFRRMTDKLTISPSDMDALTDLTGVTFVRVFEPSKVEA